MKTNRLLLDKGNIEIPFQETVDGKLNSRDDSEKATVGKGHYRSIPYRYGSDNDLSNIILASGATHNNKYIKR